MFFNTIIYPSLVYGGSERNPKSAPTNFYGMSRNFLNLAPNNHSSDFLYTQMFCPKGLEMVWRMLMFGFWKRMLGFRKRMFGFGKLMFGFRKLMFGFGKLMFQSGIQMFTFWVRMLVAKRRMFCTQDLVHGKENLMFELVTLCFNTDCYARQQK